MKFIAIIPARDAYTRFPGKTLSVLQGQPMIQRVYEQVKKTIDAVYVATDDERIYKAVKTFGGDVVMTSVEHKSGTDRCREAYEKAGKGEDVIINVQGDEPFIMPCQIEAIKECFADPSTQIATLVRKFTPEDGIDALVNPNSPKVVLGNNNEALYFSRSVIPYIRGAEQSGWLQKGTFYKHIGMYAYKAEVLDAITRLPQSTLEKAESLEQLRWLQNGYKIKVGITLQETIGIDTPADLAKALEYIK